MRRKRELENLVSGETKLIFFGGKVGAHAHSESAVGSLGRGTTNRVNGIRRGGWVRVVRIIKSECLDVGSGREEGLIPGGIGDG